MRGPAFAVVSTFLAFAQVLPAGAGSAGRCGGTGNDHSRTLTCPSGQYIAGLAARGGSYLDEFSIACRKIPASGTAGELGGFSSAGPGGGNSSRSDECDAGQAVRLIRFRSGVWVDKSLFGGCSVRSGTGWSTETKSLAEIETGGIGGSSCQITCPVGEAMYKVTVKYGSWIDSIKGECRR